MYGSMRMRADGGMTMLSGFDAPNWLGLRAMADMEFLTENRTGYPLLFQSGESAFGQPLSETERRFHYMPGIPVSRHSGRPNSYLLESAFQSDRGSVYGRAEYVQKTGNDLVLPIVNLNQKFSVGELTLGYVHNLTRSGAPLNAGVGGQMTVSAKPQALTPFYGAATPVGFEIFLRLRPAHLTQVTGTMNGMQR